MTALRASHDTLLTHQSALSLCIQIHKSASMDSLTDTTAALQISQAAASSSAAVAASAPLPAAAAAFVLHVVDQSGAPSDAPIELVEGAASHIGPLCWDDHADGSVTVAQVKQAIAERIASRAAPAAGSDATAASAPAAEGADAAPLPPLAVDHMRLVYLTQRVSLQSQPLCAPLATLCVHGKLHETS